MNALKNGSHYVTLWVQNIFNSCFKWAKKERKYDKNKCPKPTAGDIIQSLA